MTAARDLIAGHLLERGFASTQHDADCKANGLLSDLLSAPESVRIELAALINPWRTMDTAPKDGTKIDLLFPGVRGRTINCFWTDDSVHTGWVWLTPRWEKGELLPESKWYTNMYLNMEPTHWCRPLVAPPSEDKA